MAEEKPPAKPEEKKPEEKKPMEEKKPEVKPAETEGDEGAMQEIQQHLSQMSPEELEEFCTHLKHMHGQIHGAATPAAATPAAPEHTPMHRDNAELAQYARENAELKSSVTRLQETVGALTHTTIVNERSDELRDLGAQGYQVVPKDYEKAARYSKDQWIEHLEDEIKTNRQRNHSADQLIAIAGTGSDDNLPSDEERAQMRVNYQRDQRVEKNLNRFDKVVNYMREKGITYAEAEKAIDKHGNIKKTA